MRNEIPYEMNSVIQGDCLELMKKLPDKSIDLVLTDPPYNDITHNGARLSTLKKFGDIPFNQLTSLDYISELLRLSKSWIIVFCPIEWLGLIQKKYIDKYVRGCIWDRINNSPQISGDRPAQGGEGIALLHCGGRKKWNGGGKAGIFRHSVERGKKQHPTQKPIKLLTELIFLFSSNGQIILDPFAGSGTTLVAAQELGRDFIGFEISEKYCEIARERLRHVPLITP